MKIPQKIHPNQSINPNSTASPNILVQTAWAPGYCRAPVHSGTPIRWESYSPFASWLPLWLEVRKIIDSKVSAGMGYVSSRQRVSSFTFSVLLRLGSLQLCEKKMCEKKKDKPSRTSWSRISAEVGVWALWLHCSGFWHQWWWFFSLIDLLIVHKKPPQSWWGFSIPIQSLCKFGSSGFAIITWNNPKK